MSWFNQKGASTDIRHTLETREHNYRYVRSLKKILKHHLAQLCTSKFENLGEMDNFLRKHSIKIDPSRHES